MTIDDDQKSLRQWYAEHVRPLLEDVASDRVPPLDLAYQRLEGQAVPELPICFLGNAGVGKSTLLNALVAGAGWVVPQGGVGPLTAQATLVRYAESRRFRATYLPKGRLNNVLFALERSYEAELRRTGGEPPPSGRDADEEVDEETELDVAVAAYTGESDLAGNPRDKVDGYLRQASLMILGTQFPEPPADPRYLMDGLRACMGRQPRWGFEPRPEDWTRIERVRAAVGHAADERPLDVHFAGDHEAFLSQLELHASGHLAPLIRTLEVWWDADALSSGITLVDLPGVGVANDEYQRVTAEWIRRARAVVLVVDAKGVTEASAGLLRSTGFLNSMLHESGNEDDAPQLIVAPVKLDLVANDEWRNERERLHDRARKWLTHFDDVCQRIERLVRGQLREELDRIADEGGDATRANRQEVSERVLADLRIQPMTPYEYRVLLRDDEEERPRIRQPEDSRVPAFLDMLTAFGVSREQRLHTRARAHAREARDRARANLELIQEQWLENERASEEATRLRQELEEFVRPLQDELLVRHGQFRALLRKEIPTQIELRTANAAELARRDIVRYLRRFEDYPWATVRAAIRRGGTFVGARHVDLPNELTLRFEEPLAVVWSREILTIVRRETKAMAEDHVRLVGRVVEWARKQGGRVKPAVVEALHDELKLQAQEVANVGKEKVDALKEAVKTQLYAAVEAEVRKRCSRFVKSNQDVGRGVRDRMLAFLGNDLADAVVDTAKPIAQRVLTANYTKVAEEIKDALKSVENPLQTAMNAIVSDHEAHIRRSDAQKRRSVLARVEAAMAAMPVVVLGEVP